MIGKRRVRDTDTRCENNMIKCSTKTKLKSKHTKAVCA